MRLKCIHRWRLASSWSSAAPVSAVIAMASLSRSPVVRSGRAAVAVGQRYLGAEGGAIPSATLAQVRPELAPHRRSRAMGGCPQLDDTHDIRLVELAKSYGAVRAVDGVDLEIARGEFFTML